MKVILLFCALAWSFAAAGQQTVTYYAGPQKAPLFLKSQPSERTRCAASKDEMLNPYDTQAGRL